MSARNPNRRHETESYDASETIRAFKTHAEMLVELIEEIDSLHILRVKPQKWPKKKFGDIAVINPRKPKEFSEFPADHLVSFVPMAAVDEITGRITKEETRFISEVRKGFTYFADGDVIFAKITPCMQNGKSAVAQGLANGAGFGSTEFHVLRANSDQIIPEWIWYFVLQPVFRREAMLHFRGSAGQQRVPESFLADSLIPVPPLDEQKRIIAVVSGLLTRIDDIRNVAIDVANRESALVQSLLTEAFAGEL
jgi:type I restriction enzyme S subunit